MFNQFTSEEKRLAELEIQNAALEKETSRLFESLQITPEQLEHFLQDPAQFSHQELAELENRRQELEENLRKELSQVKDLKKAKEEQQKRNLPPHALFCK